MQAPNLGIQRMLADKCQPALRGTSNKASILPDNMSYLQRRRGRLFYTLGLGFSQHVCNLCQPFPLLLAVLAPLGCLLGPGWGQVHMHALRIRHRGRDGGGGGASTSVWKHLALCSVLLLLAHSAFRLDGVQHS